MERYSVSLRIQSECGKIRENADQNNSEHGLFLHSADVKHFKSDALRTITSITRSMLN